MILQESFIGQNNEILYFKEQVHNQSTKLNGLLNSVHELLG